MIGVNSLLTCSGCTGDECRTNGSLPIVGKGHHQSIVITFSGLNLQFEGEIHQIDVIGRIGIQVIGVSLRLLLELNGGTVEEMMLVDDACLQALGLCVRNVL